ncbi:MAG: hypothetical protein U1C33_07455, partial [Candidatus Cloacimonadaceae bacterium]|nr:hypothetical protein [Candidatus Cloacimonadaceae bacterium]
SEYLIHGIFDAGGKIFVNARKYWRNSSILEFDGSGLIPVIDTPNREIISSVEDDFLIFTANYEEFLHSYLYQVSTGKLYRIEGSDYMTDASLAPDGKSVYYITLSDIGFEIAKDDLHISKYELPDFPESLPPVKAYTDKDYVADTGIIKRRGGYLDNLKHLIVPRNIRLPLVASGSDSLSLGYVLSGSDVIGHFPFWQAMLVYDFKQEEFKVEASIENALFSPVYHSLYFSSTDGNKLISDQFLYLLRRKNFGISMIRTGFDYETKNDFHRKIVSPYLDFSLTGTHIRNYNRIGGKFEGYDFIISDRDRAGFHTTHHTRLFLPPRMEIASALH